MANLFSQLPSLALRGLFLLAAAWTLTTLARRASAAARHLIWTAATTGLLALTLLAPLPGWRILPEWSNHLFLPSLLSASTTTHTAASSNTPAPAAPASSTLQLSATELAAIPLIATTLWSLGVALALLPSILGRWRLHRLERRCTHLQSQQWISILNESRQALSFGQKIRLLLGPPGSMPMAWGILRPRLLLPAEATAWPAQRLRLVLLHELAHIHRRDALTHLLAQLARALHWFNPLAWLAVSRMQIERERACDDLVLSLGAPAPDYAAELLAIATSSRRAPIDAMAMATPTRLESRLRSILDRRNRARITARHTLAAALLLTLIILPVACVHTKSVAPTEPTASHDKAGTPFDGPFYRTSSRLLAVGNAICIYAGKHEQHLPPDLGAAFTAMQASSIYTTDEAGRPLTDADCAAKFLSVKDEQSIQIPDDPTPEWINAHTSFAYLGSADILWTDVPDWDHTVIAHSAILDAFAGAPPDFRGRALCMLDAHVELVSQAEADRLIAESKDRLAAARKK